MSDLFKPKTEAQAAQIVADAASKGTKLELIGNGSKRSIGNEVAADAQLSASGMSGIIQYDPAELVMVAKAGTPLSEINAVLEENKQMHVFEPPNFGALLGTSDEQTIGGIAATNLSGPRRYALGAARDSLLGVRFVNGKGEIIKNGGQVMKNVTGLDLVKLMAGSWGTLGLLTEVSFKVLPSPPTQITVAVHNQSDAEAAQTMAAAMATSADVTGAAHAPVGVAAKLLGKTVDGGVTFLRLEGLSETIDARRERLLKALPKGAEIEDLDADQTLSLWSSLRDVTPFADGSETPVWKISVAPMAGAKVVSEVLSKMDGQAYYDWQGGLVWLNLGAEDSADAATIRSAVLANGGGHATLIRGSKDLRAITPVFQPETPSVAALSARIKAAMDPNGIFNIGKMVFDPKTLAA